MRASEVDLDFDFGSRWSRSADLAGILCGDETELHWSYPRFGSDQVTGFVGTASLHVRLKPSALSRGGAATGRFGDGDVTIEYEVAQSSYTVSGSLGAADVGLSFVRVTDGTLVARSDGGARSKHKLDISGGKLRPGIRGTADDPTVAIVAAILAGELLREARNSIQVSGPSGFGYPVYGPR